MHPRVVILAVALIPGGLLAQRPAPPKAMTAFGNDSVLAEYLRRLIRSGPQDGPGTVSCTGPAPTQGVMRKASAAATGPAVIHGHVRDLEGKAIAAASVTWSIANIGTMTSEDGSYALHIPAGRFPAPAGIEVAVRRVGYEAQGHTAPIGAGDSVQVDFTLCPQMMVLNSIVLAGALQQESITNTQHEGVDEGGIVKVHGEHLIVLRRGRLFTVRMGDRHLTPIAAVDAFGPGIDPDDAWYDEMLVADGRVIVIGYSYARGGTEVGLFDLAGDGWLAHRATYHLSSNDYYSSRNYASRLVGGKLVFYTPLFLTPRTADPLTALPAMRRWRARMGADSGFRPIASARRVYRAAGLPDTLDSPTLHTVTTCDVGAREMTCDATVVIGPDAHTFHVSPTATYVWASEADAERGMPRRRGVLYRLPLDGSPPGAVGVSGSPIDQFSFLESSDGHVNVMVSSDGRGSWMWGAERARGSLALLRIPLASFGDGSATMPAAAYRALPGADEGALQNRFVGDHLLYGSGNSWGAADVSRSTLHVVPWRGGDISSLALPHGVDRIEAMGSDAVVIGSDERNLHFTSVGLAARARVRGRYALAAASQGELRSHGFFFRADGPSSGVLGLPVAGAERKGYEHLFDNSMSIAYFAVSEGRFTHLGELAARTRGFRNDGCKSSCMDWYGNARPIFIRGRVMSLLGYELIEGRIGGGRIREVRRVDFTPKSGR